MFTSCGKEAFNPICGKWRGYYPDGTTLTLEFKADGTFTQINSGDNKLWSGTFSTSGNSITMIYEKVEYNGRTYAATGTTTYTYTYSVSGDVLTIDNNRLGKI